MFEKLELLRPFDQKQAEAGDPISWSHLSEPVTFVGMCNNGKVAVNCADGLIETPCSSSLRMKPLFWKEGKPVYVGDSLWHTIDKKWIVVTKLQGHPDSEKEGYFVDNYGLDAAATLCTFDAQPVPLFYFEDRPVFKGDKLWNTAYRRWVEVDHMQPIPFLHGYYYFFDTEDKHNCTEFCLWEEPTPAPLFILRGREVFVGDKLWHIHEKKFIIVMKMLGTSGFEDENGIGRSLCNCLWEEPTETYIRYTNVYNRFDGGYIAGNLHLCEEDAKSTASRGALAVARVEWKE